MNSKNIVVTGGAGFIGSQVVRDCLGAGHKVLVIDNFENGSLSNLPSGHKNLQVAQLDIQNPAVQKELHKFRPYAVVHLAAQMDVGTSVKKPAYDAQLNIVGSINMLEAAKHAGTQVFVGASSSAIYGNPGDLPLPLSEDAPIRPISPYGASKASMENYFGVYDRQPTDLRCVALRFANVYGPRQGNSAEGGVISIFAKKMSRGENPTVYGDGLQTRDFVHVTDTSRAVLLAIECNNAHGAYHISTGRQSTLRQVHQIMANELNFFGSQIFAPAKAGDVRNSCLDNSRAKIELNWQPSMDLHAGLQEYLDHLQQTKQENHEKPPALATSRWQDSWATFILRPNFFSAYFNQLIGYISAPWSKHAPSNPIQEKSHVG